MLAAYYPQGWCSHPDGRPWCKLDFNHKYVTQNVSQGIPGVMFSSRRSSLWGRIWSKHRPAECLSPHNIAYKIADYTLLTEDQSNFKLFDTLYLTTLPWISEALPAARQVASHCSDLSMPCGPGAGGIPLWLEADPNIRTASSTWTKKHHAEGFGVCPTGQSTHDWGLGPRFENFQFRYKRKNRLPQVHPTC